MLRGPDRLHFSSNEITLKITCVDHVYLKTTHHQHPRDIVQKRPLKIVQCSKLVEDDGKALLEISDTTRRV